MNGLDVDRLLTSDVQVMNYGYQGIFSVDKLPSSYTGACVLNTSPSNVSEGHWVAVVDRMFFCSFGVNPEVYGIYGTRAYNDVQLQSLTSSVCGLYAVAYIKAHVRRYTTQDFINCFTCDYTANDMKLITAFRLGADELPHPSHCRRRLPWE